MFIWSVLAYLNKLCHRARIHITWNDHTISLKCAIAKCQIFEKYPNLFIYFSTTEVDTQRVWGIACTHKVHERNKCVWLLFVLTARTIIIISPSNFMSFSIFLTMSSVNSSSTNLQRRQHKKRHQTERVAFRTWHGLNALFIQNKMSSCNSYLNQNLFFFHGLSSDAVLWFRIKTKFYKFRW